MQATALVFDVLMEPGAHAVLMRQVYNKTRSYLEWLAQRIGGAVTIVDDGDWRALAAAIRPETRLVFAETFTNPLVRAQDLGALREVIDRGAGDGAGVALRARYDHRHAVGIQASRRSIRASTSSSAAAPSRWAATTATCGATSRRTTRRSPTA